MNMCACVHQSERGSMPQREDKTGKNSQGGKSMEYTTKGKKASVNGVQPTQKGTRESWGWQARQEPAHVVLHRLVLWFTYQVSPKGPCINCSVPSSELLGGG